MRKLFLLFLCGSTLLIACERDDTDYSNRSLPESSSDIAGEQYNEIIENPWTQTIDQPVSTFSIDADGGAYTNCRRFIESGQRPPADAVRTEEFINYFPYDYANPTDGRPIAVNGELSPCPWRDSSRLIRIGIKGKDIPKDQLPNSNIVMLVDVSGSMSSEKKLPLLKKGLLMFADAMRDNDRIAIVTYAGEAGVVLESTTGNNKDAIRKAIDKLEAGGNTNGEGGIKKAYEIAVANKIEGGNNRVILATDGDFNVGVSSQDQLIELIEEKRESGVFLTVLGIGSGNYQEGTMEQLANNGNGTYEYIDTEEQARKVFVEEYHKFFPVAQDVKVQVEFNPTNVKAYRLIGYENRMLKEEEFENDRKDAGEISIGQEVTAIYEIIPQDQVYYTKGPIYTINFRYKDPGSESSQLISLAIDREASSFEQASENMRWAAAVSAFALLLRNSPNKGTATYDDILKWGTSATSFDPNGYRTDCLILVGKAKGL